LQVKRDEDVNAARHEAVLVRRNVTTVQGGQRSMLTAMI
jgi:hypothetical protein